MNSSVFTAKMVTDLHKSVVGGGERSGVSRGAVFQMVTKQVYNTREYVNH